MGSQLESVRVAVGNLSIHALRAAGPPRAKLPPVVLVHGLGVSGRYMAPAALRLAREARVYAPDLRGFGRSGKPPGALNVAELADALAGWMGAGGVGRAALVGHSFGCQVVVDLALRRPELVGRVVLAAPLPLTEPGGRGAPRQVWRLLLDAPREPLSLVPLAAADYLRAGPSRVARTLGFALRDRAEEKLQRLRVRALVVCGSRDPVVPRRWAEEVARLLPGGEFAAVEGAAHAVNYNSPARFARLVLGFLERG